MHVELRTAQQCNARSLHIFLDTAIMCSRSCAITCRIQLATAYLQSIRMLGNFSTADDVNAMVVLAKGCCSMRAEETVVRNYVRSWDH